MRLRPRCRSWLPLFTQQLRLRNLIKIEGLNIKCDDAGAFFYYTLHQSIDSDAFYVSEYLPHRQEVNWGEIICPKLFKSNDRSVCVKVWARVLTDIASNEKDEPTVKGSDLESLSALTNELLKIDENVYQEKLLFTWGINFSGLLPLNQKKDWRFVENSLLFHLNGECFATAENLFKEISFNEKTFRKDHDEYPEVNTIENETKCIVQFRRLSSCIYNLNCEDTCQNWVYTRYIQLYFKKSDIRTSYNLKQLLNLQEIQRTQLQKFKESKDLSLEIQGRSLYCITKDHLGIPQTSFLSSSLSRYQQRNTMGRTLSELYSEQSQINPQSLLHAQKLNKQLEALRLKHRLLQSECNSYSSRISQKRNRLRALIELRQQRYSWLRSKNEQLQAENKLLCNHYQEQFLLKQKRHDILHDMERRMSALCVGLCEIYPITKNESSLSTINNVPFPSLDAFVKEAKSACATSSSDNSLPITLSVSLGYIAHLVQMIAFIINRPLRNAIIHQGSCSRIIDVIKEIPYVSQFPLYSRTTIPSKSVKYAIFLLNQNVAQLCYDITGLRCDMNLTLQNIHQIFTYLSEIQNSDENKHTSDDYNNKGFALKCSSYKNAGNGCVNIANNQISRSHSSVDINQMPFPLSTVSPENSFLQMPRSKPLLIEGSCTLRQRVSRSVGSYSDSEDDFENRDRHVYSNSDSNIAMTPDHI